MIVRLQVDRRDLAGQLLNADPGLRLRGLDFADLPVGSLGGAGMKKRDRFHGKGAGPDRKERQAPALFGRDGQLHAGAEGGRKHLAVRHLPALWQFWQHDAGRGPDFRRVEMRGLRLRGHVLAQLGGGMRAHRLFHEGRRLLRGHHAAGAERPEGRMGGPADADEERHGRGTPEDGHGRPEGQRPLQAPRRFAGFRPVFAARRRQREAQLVPDPQIGHDARGNVGPFGQISLDRDAPGHRQLVVDIGVEIGIENGVSRAHRRNLPRV